MAVVGRFGGRDVLAQEGRGGETKRNDKNGLVWRCAKGEGLLESFSLQSALTSRSASSPLLLFSRRRGNVSVSRRAIRARRGDLVVSAALYFGGTYGNPCCIVSGVIPEQHLCECASLERYSRPV